MAKIIKLTESDLNRIVRRVIKEQPSKVDNSWKQVINYLKKGFKYNSDYYSFRKILEMGTMVLLDNETPVPNFVEGKKNLVISNYEGKKDYDIYVTKWSQRQNKWESGGSVIEQGTWFWDGKKLTLQKK